ncbi:MAG: DUF2027 domain-containing protein [Saprospiraceae bacterium]|nr:DUF2027 domain-containing protein [Saprospiraceae bacterium]
MNLKVGDKVKFLDEEGGGIVSKIISSSLVNVTTEDGFEIPTITSKLIKIEKQDATESENMFIPDFDIKIQNSNSKENLPVETTFSLPNYSSLEPKPKGIYLCFVPHNQNLLISGDMDIYLVNFSKFDILFNLHLKTNNNYSGFDYGSVAPHSKYLIQTIEREDLENWLSGNIQLLFHHENTKKLLHPSETDFKFKITRFIKEENYRAVSFMGEKSIVVSICEISELEKDTEIVEKAEDNFKIGKSRIVTNNTFIDKHKVDENSAEIDLHIGEIVENFSHLSKIEILTIQLDYFEKCLESALQNNIKQLVVIHGVGQGILKSEIRKAFEKYDIEYFDAAIAKYGVGATEGRVK